MFQIIPPFIRRLAALLILPLVVVSGTASHASEPLMPFILAWQGSGDVQAKADDVAATLAAAGFEIAGRYSPYPSAQIIVVTDAMLKRTAAESEFGGYAAGQRVSITKVGDGLQVAFSNPRYVALAYGLAGDLSTTADRLGTTLGHIKAYGPDEGVDAEDLGDYRYMFGMERFTDPDTLKRHSSHQAAIAEVEKNLAAGVMGITKVYRIDIPGKEEVVFGVAMNGKKGNGDTQDDAFIMKEIDFKPTRSTPHLPYEILVSGDTAYALSARYRIAISFPDLSMMGANSFMSIMSAPDTIRAALTAVSGGEWKPPQVNTY